MDMDFQQSQVLVPSEVLNKSPSLPDEEDDVIVSSSYNYQEVIFQKNTRKYVLNSRSYDYIHGILGKNSTCSQKHSLTREYTEKDMEILAKDITNCRKPLKIDQHPPHMKIRIMKAKKSLKHQKTEYYFYGLLNLLFISLLVVIFARYIVTWMTTETIFLENLEHKLSTKVLNQEVAINTLIRSIEKLQETGYTKIITCLVGSTGVGKTYSINILREYMNSVDIHVFYPSDIPFLIQKQNTISSDLRHKLISSDYTVVVFDDLKLNDLRGLQNFIDMISEVEETNILLIAIFNIQNADNNLNFSVNYKDSIIIKENLKVYHNFYFAQFNELNETVIKIWLKNELVNNCISEMYHEEIINEMLKAQDISSFGLKGMSSKLLIELNKYTQELKNQQIE